MKKLILVMLLVLMSTFLFAQIEMPQDTTKEIKPMITAKTHNQALSRITQIEKAFILEHLRAESVTLEKAFMNLYLQNQNVKANNIQMQKMLELIRQMLDELSMIENKEIKKLLTKYGLVQK